MSFFRNLRARLMKSSQAIEEKIDAVIDEAPVEDGLDGGASIEPDTPADAASAQTGSDSSAASEKPALAENPPAFPPENASSGFFSRLTGRRKSLKRRLDDAMIEALEEALISADIGVETALKIIANIAQTRFNQLLDSAEIKALIGDEIKAIMTPVARPLPIYNHRPQVILVVGVNGAGKTTTIGKLAAQFRAAGKSVLIAAGDTFRAGAVEQLEIWAERAGCGFIKAPQATDPASLAFDALVRAEAENTELLLIDTAGRLQNRQDLMDELAKIIRVLKKKDPSAPHNTLLVLDATTGQNALSQVKIFQEIADISGLIMTKLDGTAKGGVLVGLADSFGLPVHAIGIGEQIDDLGAFEPEEFSDALVGNVS